MKRILTIAFLAAFTATAAAAPVPIQPYLDIRGQSVPAYAPNEAIAFFTSVTGVPQVWKTERTNAYPVQLTYGTQRAQFATFLPDGRLLYGSDRNSDENTQFYIANGDGSNTKRLLPGDGDDVRHEFSSISPDGHFVAFTSNAADRGVFNPYVLNLQTGALTALSPGPVEAYAGAFSHDGKKVLVIARRSNFDSNLSVVDLKTRASIPFTKHTGNALFECAGFLPDNRTAVCTTDKGREFVTRALVDTKTGAIHFLEPDRYDADDLTLSGDGKLAAYVRNVDGNGRLVVSNAATGKTLLVPQPPERAGVPSDLAFDAPAKHLAYTFSGGQHPGEILETDMASGKTIGRTRASLAGLSRSSFIEPKLITWKSFDGRTISGWLYKPASTGGSYPVVLDIHGGPEGQTRPTFAPIDQYFAAHGYAVLAPNVRGSTGYGRTYLHLADVRKREDSVRDIHAAYQYLTAHGADPKRVAVYGGSYGGYMVLASLTLYPEDFAAGVDVVGIANWVTFLQNTSAYRRANREATYGSLEKDKDFLASISPIAHVDRVKAPLLIFMGKNDPRVPANEGQQMADALKARNVPVDLTIFPDEGHGIGRYENRVKAYTQIAAFLDKYLAAR